MILGEKICLRRPEQEDYALIWKWWNSPEIQQYSVKHPFPPNFDTVVEEYMKSQNNKYMESFIIHSFDKTTIGTADLYNIDFRSRWSAMEIMIGEKDYINGDYIQDSLRTLLKFCFYDLNLRRIETPLIEYNETFIKFFKKCAFKKEGVLRKKILWNGKYYDQYIMGVLKEDFEK